MPSTSAEASAILQTAQAIGPALRLAIVWRASSWIERDEGISPGKAIMTKTFNRLLADQQLIEVPTAGKPLYALGPAARSKPVSTRPVLPLGRCFFPSPHRDALLAARAAVAKRFDVVERDSKVLAFRPSHTPRLHEPVFRLMATDRVTLERYASAARLRTLTRLVPRPAAYLVLAFEHLRDVLASGLVDAQHVISTATDSPIYVAWTRRIIDTL